MTRVNNGAGKWTRTTDQLLTKQLLYQLSYSGTACDYIYIYEAMKFQAALQLLFRPR